MTDPAALNADIAAILQAEVSEHLAHPPANPEAFWTYLAGVIIATPGMQAVISEANETRAQYQSELQAISLWQERYSARTKTAEAKVQRVQRLIDAVNRDLRYEITASDLTEALNPSKDAS